MFKGIQPIVTTRHIKTVYIPIEVLSGLLRVSTHFYFIYQHKELILKTLNFSSSIGNSFPYYIHRSSSLFRVFDTKRSRLERSYIKFTVSSSCTWAFNVKLCYIIVLNCCIELLYWIVVLNYDMLHHNPSYWYFIPFVMVVLFYYSVEWFIVD